MHSNDDVPPGFEPIVTSPFIEYLGRFHWLPGTGRFGMHVRPEHANTHGNAHGGFLASIVDVACSRGTRFALGDGSTVSTITMTLDYLEPVDVGRWFEVDTTVDRAGGRTVFTTGRVVVDEKVLAKASVVLARHRPRP
ncbi:PaaI family thioesterase [Pseudonocardia pini]|uniref:PaaI family thioesterase n=1 Tax=Pseudonocardia pini TaxID=2758030 RepID=UPI0015F08019|nr:PaaI family thioesterase [Pseudonocardia pini]